MKLPEYVKYRHNGLTTTFRLTESLGGKPIYYRDAGAWDIGHEYVDGVLVAKSIGVGNAYFNGLPLLEATKEEYKKDNEGYLPEFFDTRNKTATGPTPDLDINRMASEGPSQEVPDDSAPGFGENEEFLGEDEDDTEEWEVDVSILTVDAGEYFYICDSREEVNEFYYLRAIKNFEINAKGRSAYDLVMELENDGFIEVIPERAQQNCLDFAWD